VGDVLAMWPSAPRRGAWNLWSGAWGVTGDGPKGLPTAGNAATALVIDRQRSVGGCCVRVRVIVMLFGPGELLALWPASLG
jgi:hypothetical protein